MRVSGWLYILEQSVVTLCLLLALGVSGRLRLIPFRLLGVSLLCTLTGMALGTAPLLTRMLVLGAAGALGPVLAFPGMPRHLRGRTVLAGLMLSLLTAGLMRFLSPLPLPGAVLVLLACAVLGAIPLAAPKPGELPALATVEIRCGPRHVSLTALIDSGNLLRDGLTGLPVMVISRRAAAALAAHPPAGQLAPGMRLMPVRTVSGTSMMALFRPDTVSLRTGRAWQHCQCLVGISPDGDEGFQALVPACLAAGEEARACSSQ